MSGPDILAALESAPRANGSVCKLQYLLDEIPADAPGKAQLVDAVDDAKAYPAHSLMQVFARLGTPVGENLVRHHRAKRCVCWR